MIQIGSIYPPLLLPCSGFLYVQGRHGLDTLLAFDVQQPDATYLCPNRPFILLAGYMCVKDHLCHRM